MIRFAVVLVCAFAFCVEGTHVKGPDTQLCKTFFLPEDNTVLHKSLTALMSDDSLRVTVSTSMCVKGDFDALSSESNDIIAEGDFLEDKNTERAIWKLQAQMNQLKEEMKWLKSDVIEGVLAGIRTHLDARRQPGTEEKEATDSTPHLLQKSITQLTNKIEEEKTCDSGEVCVPVEKCKGRDGGGAEGNGTCQDHGERGEKVCCKEEEEEEREDEQVEGKEEETEMDDVDLPSICGRQAVKYTPTEDGDTAPFGAYPWMAAIHLQQGVNGKSVTIYSGVILNSRYVLTYGFYPEKMWKEKGIELIGKVIIGTPNLVATRYCIGTEKKKELGAEKQCFHPIVAGIEKHIAHPDFSYAITKKGFFANMYNNIALIRLNITLDFNDKSVLIAPICLPAPTDAIEMGVEGLQTGWKLRAFGANAETRIHTYNADLDTTSAQVSDADRCQKRFGISLDWNNTFCAVREGDGNANMTFYRGGPLVLPNESGAFTVVGIWSYASYEPTYHEQFISYATVHHYLPWITETAVP